MINIQDLVYKLRFTYYFVNYYSYSRVLGNYSIHLKHLFFQLFPLLLAFLFDSICTIYLLIYSKIFFDTTGALGWLGVETHFTFHYQLWLLVLFLHKSSVVPLFCSLIQNHVVGQIVRFVAAIVAYCLSTLEGVGAHGTALVVVSLVERGHAAQQGRWMTWLGS